MKNLILKISLIFALLIVFISISAYSYVSAISTSISNEVFRLHVIANSDSEADQSLKLKVRDALLEYMNTICANINSKEEAIKIAQNHLSDFHDVATKTIQDNGYTYPVEISINECDFPTKTYGDISLPAGTYDALRVKIGSSEGHNWWCVMFPPLCFVDVSSGVVPEESKEILHDSLNNEEYELITSEDSDNVTFKFKLVEFIENLKIGYLNKQ